MQYKNMVAYPVDQSGIWVNRVLKTKRVISFSIDREDWDKVKEYPWTKTKQGYIWCHEKGLLHRFLLGYPKKPKEIDRINNSKDDNRRINLRIVSRAYNLYNVNRKRNNTSGYKGVCWYPKTSRWRAYIWINQKYVSLGHYLDILDAAKARKEAELKYLNWN